MVLIGGLAAAIFAGFETVDASLSQVCSTSGYVSCAKVGSSGHTTLLGVPDWAIGIGGYLVMLAVGVLAYRTWARRYLGLLSLLSGLGILFSVYFVYEETFVIRALCPVCTTAHLLNVVVFVLALRLFRMSAPDAPKGP